MKTSRILLLHCLLVVSALGQSLKLEELTSDKHRLVGASIRLTEKSGLSGIELVPRGNNTQQMLVLDGVALVTGTIECDIFAAVESRFVGLAWHVESESSYEAVYFRPFRFKDPDPVDQRHAVQYVSHPEWPWRTLRQRFPDTYEKPCPIEPDRWISVKIVIEETRAKVFVDDLAAPVMIIEKPFLQNGRGVALWTGAGTTGVFSNLKITADTEIPATAPVLPPTSAIDLISAADPIRDTQVGDWTKSENDLEVNATRFAHLVFPVEFPKSYDLELSFTRVGESEESITALLPIGKSSVAVQFSARGTHDGIGLIDGVPSWESAPAQPTKLKSGEVFDSTISVRTSGDVASITVSIGETPHLSWEGPIGSMSLFSAYEIPAGRGGIGAFDTRTIFHKAKLIPAE